MITYIQNNNTKCAICKVQILPEIDVESSETDDESSVNDDEYIIENVNGNPYAFRAQEYSELYGELTIDYEEFLIQVYTPRIDFYRVSYAFNDD